METLPHRHLTTLTLHVDFANITPVGPTRAGQRAIAPVVDGVFAGERLSGRVIGGHDWVVTRSDGTLAIDVRLTLVTDDGATLYLSYAGNFLGSEDALKRFRNGETLSASEYSLRIIARIEGGGEAYRWLEDALIVGVGEQTRSGPIYHLFEVA